MLTLDGTPLPIPTPQILAEIERHISFDRLSLFWNRSWPGFGTLGIANPTYYRQWPIQPIHLNRYVHPTGASRYGYGLFLADTNSINLIAPDAFGGSGNASNPIDLVMSSEDQNGVLVEKVTISAVTLFPPVPIFYLDNAAGNPDLPLYVLFVADDRIFWPNVPCPDFSISEQGSVSWTTIINACRDALEYDSSNWTVSTIPAAYLQPSRALNLTGEPISIVLDAICANCGLRLAMDFSGDVSLDSFTDALGVFQGDQESVGRTIRAGGSRYLDSL
jgi:hypothetical protein